MSAILIVNEKTLFWRKMFLFSNVILRSISCVVCAWSAASIHSAACSVLRCSVTASYKDVDDVSPWWWCLYDITANHSPATALF